jgi:hypothetical protein
MSSRPDTWAVPLGAEAVWGWRTAKPTRDWTDDIKVFTSRLDAVSGLVDAGVL